MQAKPNSKKLKKKKNKPIQNKNTNLLLNQLYEELKTPIKIELTDHFENKISIEIINNLSSLIVNENITHKKLLHLIDILDSCLAKNNSIHVLNKLYPVYEKLITIHFSNTTIYSNIFNSIYIFLIKLKNIRKQISRSEINNAEKSILNTLEVGIKNHDINMEHLINIISVLNYHIQFSNKNILSKYINIYLKARIIFEKNQFIENEAKKTILSIFKKNILNKIELFPEFQTFIKVIK